MYATIVALTTLLLALSPARSGAQGTQCDGDFNGDGVVEINELVTAVNNALNNCPPPGPRFIDNANGTVTDTRTGLMWEKKSADSGIHDQDATYTWSTGSGTPDGTVFSSFLPVLNEAPCFAGHCDWRLPTLTELQSLADYARFAPAVDPIFNTACAPSCTVLTCSCTDFSGIYYWSSTPEADTSSSPANAWGVEFDFGTVNRINEALPAHARAVRGAS
jgi:hypothetical protein